MSQDTTLDLSVVRAAAEAIARKVGDGVLMRYFREGFAVMTKSTAVDVVTEADKAAEDVIVSDLTDRFPEHHIVGEEGGGMGAPVETAAYRWYVDPIDGTTNFANHIPFFSVSLALTDAQMNPLVGAVYHPAAGEMFSAAKGDGATRNGERLHVSEKTELISCVLASGFPYDKYTDPANNLDQWGRFLVKTRGLRRLGSAALDCCFVAAGRLDGYWESKLYPWDVMAGMLCVTEAGGRVTDYGGGPVDLTNDRRVVASNGHIHDAMIAVLAE